MRSWHRSRFRRPYGALRSDLVRMGPIDESDPMMREELLLVGLTAMPRESGVDEVSQLAGVLAKAAHSEFGDIAAGACLRRRWNALDPAKVEPSPQLAGQSPLRHRRGDQYARGATEVDKVLLRTVADHRTRCDAILLSGLNYRVGRQGKRLSGGQHKLVSLCRTLAAGQSGHDLG